jgi:hypothetical protein
MCSKLVEGDCCTLQQSCSVRDAFKSVATKCSAGIWMQIGMLEVFISSDVGVVGGCFLFLLTMLMCVGAAA